MPKVSLYHRPVFINIIHWKECEHIPLQYRHSVFNSGGVIYIFLYSLSSIPMKTSPSWVFSLNGYGAQSVLYVQSDINEYMNNTGIRWVHRYASVYRLVCALGITLYLRLFSIKLFTFCHFFWWIKCSIIQKLSSKMLEDGFSGQWYMLHGFYESGKWWVIHLPYTFMSLFTGIFGRCEKKNCIASINRNFSLLFLIMFSIMTVLITFECLCTFFKYSSEI